MMVALKNRTCRTMTATEVTMAMAATANWSYFWTRSVNGEEPASEDAGDAVAAGVGEAVFDLDVGSGGASLGGDGDVPPVPGPVALPAVPVSGAAPTGPRGAPPTAAATVPGGRMCYYESYGRFAAECGNEFHENCVISRQNTAAARMKGRPCAWLMAGASVSTKEEHWVMIVELKGDRAWRQSQRDALVASDCVETKTLFDSELAHPSGHSFEPVCR